ncbi:histidinol dehydrogenase [Sanyastnella coralliicola]|uniref:histidinol dehydrogenase n=1 Tax=Sanyastnella coralliicola TaxID=3069118 RepID=UPI0027BAF6BF|nr:histidinol dehydrogenase [Longitalea sp. SCSIO 12813]
MRVVYNPPKKLWSQLVERPFTNDRDRELLVNQILQSVKSRGDAALFDYTEQFDGVRLNTLDLPLEFIDSREVSIELQKAIRLASQNIRTFHEAQRRDASVVSTSPGITCWREYRAIERVGIYIPGGTAPLFSTVLMLAIPAAIAGCKEVVLCTPPDRNGNIDPTIALAAKWSGVTQIFKVGGAQAIAAMGYGTASIPKVDKIFGPGNSFVTLAKEQLQAEGVAIDLPAGPSELLVIADDQANPAFVASDLLSQAEHGTDSQVILATTSEATAKAVNAEIENQISALARKDIAQKALSNSVAVVFNSISQVIEFSNAYAPEHLIINTTAPMKVLPLIANAGSIFLGPYAAESVGDYISGTNHTLPTNGAARAYSGVSLEQFQKAITVQEVDQKGIRAVGPSVEIMAKAEALDGHANAITVRLKSLES